MAPRWKVHLLAGRGSEAVMCQRQGSQVNSMERQEFEKLERVHRCKACWRALSKLEQEAGDG